MNDKMKAAVIGGVVIGVLSLIPFVSSCCCLWAIGGGLLAAYLYISKSATPVQTGEGAMLGLMAGGIGALIYLIVGIPISLIFGLANLANMEDQFRQKGIEIPFTGIALLIIGMLMMVVGLVIFSTLGGLLGVPLFEKRKGGGPSTPAPPPPPSFGGEPQQPGAGYSTYGSGS